MSVIEISGLRKRYGKIEALRGVDFSVEQGAIYGLVGPNGAGKSTLIKAMVGSLRPNSGTIRVFNLDPIHDRWSLRKRIGYMPQSAALYEDLSAQENIAFFGRAHHTTNLNKKVDEILDFTELRDRANDPVHTFSGGMKKRVSLACALIHEPEMLLLDEPTAAVDPHLKARSWDFFRELAGRGITLFISTHLMDEALLCDSVAILRRGEMIAVDTPERILQRGSTRVVVQQGTQKHTNQIASTPEALAKHLYQFGLSADVTSVTLQQDSLESIILSLVNKQEKKV